MAVTTTIDHDLALLLVEASIQAYNAYDADDPATCRVRPPTTDREPGVRPPPGYEVVGCWTGIDTILSVSYNDVECYGVVFRSLTGPYTYIFAFRGTNSILDLIEDLASLAAEPFRAHGGIETPADATVASGFLSVYLAAMSNVPCMQAQLFALLGQYQQSDKPISKLLITGHSLGGVLAELFTLDVALSPYQRIPYWHYNYASPRAGTKGFRTLYDGQAREQDPSTRTLRVQNTYDIVPCYPLESFGYSHVGDAYLLAFYNASWLDVDPKFHDHQAFNYQAVMACAFESEGGVCINDKLEVRADSEILVSKKPDRTTLCSPWP